MTTEAQPVPSRPPGARGGPAGDGVRLPARLVARGQAGELGSLPIVVGLVVILVTFGILDDTFLTERNFTNLLLQMAAIATIAIGVVFVLLIGEIDLSVAFVERSGRRRDDAAPATGRSRVALVARDRRGAPLNNGDRFLQALVITKAGVPSFVVTLAGLLIWSGVVLILTTHSTSGTIRIQDETVVGIANDFLSDVWGWVLGARWWRATRSSSCGEVQRRAAA